jgi:hypothetical protein
MIDSNRRFQPKTEEIAASIIDGETIIVNLSNGNYFSTDGTGTEIWSMIEQRRSVAEMHAIFSQRNGADGQRVSDDLGALLEKMLNENIIEDANAPPNSHAETLQPSGSAPDYQSPVFHVYRDMSDLLALDPPMPGLRDIPWKDPGTTG